MTDKQAQRNPNGSQRWDFGSGALVTGEVVAVHESMQMPGLPPNPAHRIEHTEFICVCAGSLEFQHDGRSERAEAGDILLVAKGTLHGARNVGSEAAKYFVVAIGGDVQ